MNPILFLSLVIILSAALPWWPYSAYGRSRHRHQWDWLLDTPSREDYRTGKTSMLSTTTLMRPRFSISETRHRATPGASQKAAIKLCDGKWKTQLMKGDVTLLRQFKERWIEAESNRAALSATV